MCQLFMYTRWSKEVNPSSNEGRRQILNCFPFPSRSWFYERKLDLAIMKSPLNLDKVLQREIQSAVLFTIFQYITQLLVL